MTDAPSHDRPAPSGSLAERVRAVLERQLAPLSLVVEDESARHAGHPGAREGGHLRVRVVSERFRGLAPLARHRLVYTAITEITGDPNGNPGDGSDSRAAGGNTLKGAGVHALAIDARTPEEATS